MYKRQVLTFTSIGPDGRFHSSLIHTLLGDLQLQQRIIWQLGRTMQEKGFQGIDIDFEYIPAEDRVPFAEFVALVRHILSPFGYRVSVALAPKTSSDQQGLLYEGVDYRLLGEAADQVMLMTYEWGYTFAHIGLWLWTQRNLRVYRQFEVYIMQVSLLITFVLYIRNSINDIFQ